MFPRYLQYLSTDFRQTFVTGASRDRDELIRFWGQKVKVQGHTIAAEAHSTRRYRRVQLFLVTFVFYCNVSGRMVLLFLIKPPPPVGAGGGYMFSGRPSVPPSVRPCVRPSVRDSRGSFMFSRYLQYLLTDFRQTFVTGASRDKDELVRFWGQKVKVQGHGMTECIPDSHVSTISPSIY